MTKVLYDYFDIVGKNLLLTLNTSDAYLNKIALTVIAIIITSLLHIVFKNIIISNVVDLKQRFKFHKVIKNGIFILTIILILFIWIKAINALVLIVLFFGAFIVIMVRGLIHNIIGYFVIKYQKYFEVGHRVEINDIIGDVVEINPISFELLEVRNWLSSDSNTGRVIQVPNSIIFEETIEKIGIANIFIWHEIKYVLSFDSNWQEAEKIMIDVGHLYYEETVLPSLKKVNGYLPSDKTEIKPVFSLNTNDSGITVSLRYLVDYKKGTKTKTELQRKILSGFEEREDVKFAALSVRIL